MIKTRARFQKTRKKMPNWLLLMFPLALAGCGSSSDSNDEAYIQLYNVSQNSPEIYLTVDKYDDDDFNDRTYSPVAFTEASTRIEVDDDTYDIELAWQDEYNNNNDLEIIHEQELRVDLNYVQFLVVAEDIQDPQIYTYNLRTRNDDEFDDDDDDDLFNVRVLNMHPMSGGVDIYYSQANATINEAQLLASTTYTEMAENQKLDQNEYIFYLTAAGSRDVLLKTESIDFDFPSEYILAIRENTGAGNSPFILDRISTTSATEYADLDAEARYRVYNGIVTNELIPDYTGSIDFHVGEIDDTPEVENLAFSETSESMVEPSKDYSMNVVDAENGSMIISNHLLPLAENSDQTVFLYLHEKAVDEDGDGIIDEDNDGKIDELEVTLHSLVIENKQSESIFSHEVKVVNLIDEDEIEDDFDFIRVYFVRNDETIETADQSVRADFAEPENVDLVNNTYDVYVIGRLDSSDLILSSDVITLDEDSRDFYMVLEKDASTVTGYKHSFFDQIPSEDLE